MITTIIFDLLIKKAHLKPQECLFIDDYNKNIESAQKLRFETALFTSAVDLTNKLKELKIRL